MAISQCLHPVATKKALRAILKGTNLCATDPEAAARFIVKRGYAGRVEYATQAMREIPYTRWRDYDPEDTVRFYALRLREVGMIKNSAQKFLPRARTGVFSTSSSAS